ncbi:hypothetical protein [Kineococcus arenarius]|uniref:hypothetical protein n=1 Tax=Kineococcus sp. SYSU DK007 TaxID=3383128 RepID=UPI003D7E4C16
MIAEDGGGTGHASITRVEVLDQQGPPFQVAAGAYQYRAVGFTAAPEHEWLA